MSDAASAPCSPAELIEKRNANDDHILVDVRTPGELRIASIEGAINIPVQEIQTRIEELDVYKEKEIIVLCHHGMRSAMAREFLLSVGFTNVRNLSGGIDAIADIDTTIPRY